MTTDPAEKQTEEHAVASTPHFKNEDAGGMMSLVKMISLRIFKNSRFPDMLQSSRTINIFGDELIITSDENVSHIALIDVTIGIFTEPECELYIYLYVCAQVFNVYLNGHAISSAVN